MITILSFVLAAISMRLYPMRPELRKVSIRYTWMYDIPAYIFAFLFWFLVLGVFVEVNIGSGTMDAEADMIEAFLDGIIRDLNNYGDSL